MEDNTNSLQQQLQPSIMQEEEDLDEDDLLQTQNEKYPFEFVKDAVRSHWKTVLAALALLFWAISAGHGLGPILSQPSKFTTSAEFWNFFFPALTGMVGFWATLSLNIPDFTRYAKSQKAQITGQAIGLPTSMTLFSFIGVVVTSATLIIYGETIWDPVILAGKFDSKVFEVWQ